MKKIVNYWLPPLLWAAFIFTFSSMKTPQTSTVYWKDFVVKKIAHLIEYSILFLLLYRAFKNTTKLSFYKAGLFALLIIVLYAISDEFHQSFTPGREPTVRDVLIDTTAALLTWGGLWKLLPKMPKKLLTLAKILQVS